MGLYLYNSSEYLETQFASMKGRGVPININYRYLDDELLYLLEIPIPKPWSSTPAWAIASPV